MAKEEKFGFAVVMRFKWFRFIGFIVRVCMRDDCSVNHFVFMKEYRLVGD